LLFLYGHLVIKYGLEIVSDECCGHLQTPGWDIADGRLHVVWNPFHKERGIFVQNVQHLFVLRFVRKLYEAI
jgi:hypothetical protein